MFWRKGFTIVEVMVASLLLAWVFFSILKLTNNNVRLVGVMDDSRDATDIAMSSRACLETFGYTYLKGLTSTESLNFWSDHTKCLTGSYDPTLSFTGISLSLILWTWSEKKVSEKTFWNYYSTGSLLSGSGIEVNSYVDNGKTVKKYTFQIYPR